MTNAYTGELVFFMVFTCAGLHDMHHALSRQLATSVGCLDMREQPGVNEYPHIMNN